MATFYPMLVRVTPKQPPVPNHIITSRASFLEAIASVVSSHKKLQGEAVIVRDGTTMKLVLGGASFTFDAEGPWDHRVRVPCSWIDALHRSPPMHDPITITAENARLEIGASSVGCIMEVNDGRGVPVLPLGTDLPTKARLLFTYSKEDLQRGGIYDEVSQAGPTLQGLVQKAAKALAPFGVTEDDLMALVKTRLGVR